MKCVQDIFHTKKVCETGRFDGILFPVFTHFPKVLYPVFIDGNDLQ